MNNNNLKPGVATLIEFFGAPGVGKSYLSNELVMQLKTEGVRFSSQAVDIGAMPTLRRMYSKLCYIVPFFVLKPLMVADVFKFVFSSGVRGAMAVITVTINWLFVLGVLKWEFQKNDIVIFDQGLAQAYWSTVFRGAAADPAKFHNFLCPLLDACGVRNMLIVDVSLDRKEHQVRLSSRNDGRSPLDDRDPMKFELGLQAAKSVRNILCGFEGVISNLRIALLKYENGGSSSNEKLYERLLIATFKTTQ